MTSDEYFRADPSSPMGDPQTHKPAKPPKKRAWNTAALLAAAAIVGGAAGAVVSNVTTTAQKAPAAPASSKSSPTSSPSSSPTSSPPTIKFTNVGPGPAIANGVSIPTVVKEVLPRVVSVDATGTVTAPSGNPFGIGSGAAGEQFKSAGTGMILSTTGLVLTNNHVVAGATSVAVTLDGQTKALPASIVGTDPSHDMALLKIDNPPKNLQTVTFGNSTALVPGDAVIAIGNALGLAAGSPTITSGIVSALGRQVSATIPNTNQTESLTNMIQTDAAINPGNSGGPLVDSAGDVVGMNTATAGTTSDGTQAQNIGFAIPASAIMNELPTLEKGGTSGAPGAYMGVVVEDNSPALAQEYGFATHTGAVVIAVEPGSPASRAGLSAGDIIIALAGKTVNSSATLGTIESSLSQGSRVSLTLYEGARKVTTEITLGTRPAP